MSATKVRVQCLAIGRITVAPDQYLLVADRTVYNKSKGATRIWEPPQGVLDATPSGLVKLFAMNGFANGKQFGLSFTVAGTELKNVKEWFAKRQGRETSPTRVIGEQFSQSWGQTEDPLLLHPGLVRAGVHNHGWTELTLSEPRPGPNPARQQTLYLADINTLLPSVEAKGRICAIAARLGAALTLATEKEIMEGKTNTGEKIHPLAAHMIKPEHPDKK